MKMVNATWCIRRAEHGAVRVNLCCKNHEKFNLVVSKCIVIWFIKLPETLHSFSYNIEHITKEEITCFHEIRNHKTTENQI